MVQDDSILALLWTTQCVIMSGELGSAILLGLVTNFQFLQITEAEFGG